MILALHIFVSEVASRNGTNSKAFRSWCGMSIEDATEMVREYLAETEGHCVKVKGLLRQVEPGMLVIASCKAMQCLRTFCFDDFLFSMFETSSMNCLHHATCRNWCWAKKSFLARVPSQSMSKSSLFEVMFLWHQDLCVLLSFR